MQMRNYGRNLQVAVKKTIVVASAGPEHPEDFCPDCSARLTHEEGCDKCFACGYSRC